MAAGLFTFPSKLSSSPESFHFTTILSQNLPKGFRNASLYRLPVLIFLIVLAEIPAPD
jgi:hypothetical protein